MYITNGGDDTVSVIETAGHTVIDTIAVGNTPVGIEMQPDGSRLYVANRDGASISVIDTATNAVIDTVAVGASPNFMIVHPGGLAVYVPNVADDNVSVIYSATNDVVSTVPVGDFPVLVMIDPKRPRIAYVANADDIQIIDLATNATSATIPFPGPGDFAFHPDGESMYVPSFAENTVYLLDADDGSVIDTIAVGDGPIDTTMGFVAPCPADLGGDGSVGFADLLEVLSSWGPCP
jgi:YVTN family beta-propeller protein